MALSATDQNFIIDKESEWIDSSFGSIDLSAFPTLQTQPPPEKHDDRFARDWRDTGLSRDASAMRQFVENPDVDAIRQIGEETNNANFLADYRNRQGETIAEQFKKRRPDYLQTDRNYEAMVETLSFNCLSSYQQEGTIEEQVKDLIDGQFWTPDNLVATYDALDAAGLLQVPAGQARNLGERERLHVIRLAQSGDAQAAIDQFLCYASRPFTP